MKGEPRPDGAAAALADSAPSPQGMTADEWMRWFGQQITKPDDPCRAPDLVNTTRALAPNPWLTPQAQLELYRRQFWLRHNDSLREDFPALSAFLGAADWERLARSYLATRPLSHYSLRRLGEELSAHTVQCIGLPNPSFCCALSALEWARVEAFDAPSWVEDAPFAPEAPALNPSLRLLALEHPTRRQRLQLLRGGPMRVPGKAAEYLAVYRSQAGRILTEELEPAAFYILQALQCGDELLATLEGCLAQHGEAAVTPTQVEAWFLRWGQLGWLPARSPEPPDRQ